MALKRYQTLITKDTLYEAAKKGGSEQIQPNIETMGGTATLYTAQELPTSDPLTDEMVADSATLDGVNILQAVPNYIYISGSATSVIVSGVRLKEVV